MFKLKETVPNRIYQNLFSEYVVTTFKSVLTKETKDNTVVGSNLAKVIKRIYIFILLYIPNT